MNFQNSFLTHLTCHSHFHTTNLTTIYNRTPPPGQGLPAESRIQAGMSKKPRRGCLQPEGGLDAFVLSQRRDKQPILLAEMLFTGGTAKMGSEKNSGNSLGISLISEILGKNSGAFKAPGNWAEVQLFSFSLPQGCSILCTICKALTCSKTKQ